MSKFDKAQSLPIDQRAELSYQLAESLMDSLIEEDEYIQSSGRHLFCQKR